MGTQRKGNEATFTCWNVATFAQKVDEAKEKT